MYTAEDLAEITIREAAALALLHAPSPFSIKLIGHIVAHSPDKELVDYGAPVDVVFSSTAKIQLDRKARAFYDQTAMCLIELRGFMGMFGPSATADEEVDSAGPAAEQPSSRSLGDDAAGDPAGLDRVFSSAVVGLLVEKIMSSTYDTRAARLAAVNKFLPRSGLADFYPGAAEPGGLCPGTRRTVMERIKEARQKLVVRWAQASTDARLATAVDTLTADLAATAAAQQFLAMYDATIVARATAKADAAAAPGTGVRGSAAAGINAEAEDSTAVTGHSSSDMVPVLSGSGSASGTGAAPQSAASPAKRAGTAAPSPGRKRARSSASGQFQATQPSSPSQLSISLLQPAPDTDDTADAAAADDDDGDGAATRPSSPSVASIGGGSTAGGSTSPRKSPRRRTNGMTPVKSQSPATQAFSQIPETQELFMPKSQYPHLSSDEDEEDDDDDDETQMTQNTPIWECVEIRGHRKSKERSANGNPSRNPLRDFDFLVSWIFEGKLLKDAEWVLAADLADVDKLVPLGMINSYLER